MHLGMEQFLISHPNASLSQYGSYAEHAASAIGKELLPTNEHKLLNNFSRPIKLQYFFRAKFEKGN